MDFTTLLINIAINLSVIVLILLFVIPTIRRNSQRLNTQMDFMHETLQRQEDNFVRFNETAALQQENLTLLSNTATTQQENLSTLNETAITQQQNLAAMEKRIIEIEKVSDIYQSLFDEIPQAVEKYDRLMSARKATATEELDAAAAMQDDDLQQFKEKELEGIEARERLINELPNLIIQFHRALDPLNERLKLFSDKEKFGAASILSYKAKRAKTFLSALGEQSQRLNERYLGYTEMPAAIPERTVSPSLPEPTSINEETSN